MKSGQQYPQKIPFKHEMEWPKAIIWFRCYNQILHDKSQETMVNMLTPRNEEISAMEFKWWLTILRLGMQVNDFAQFTNWIMIQFQNKINFRNQGNLGTT